MAIVLSVLAVLAWLPLMVMFLYRWLWQGIEFSQLAEILDLPTGIAMTLGAIAVTSFWTAVICALIVGVGNCISYRNPGTSQTTAKREAERGGPLR